MSIASEYQRQLQWRDWATAFDALPDVRGRTVLDLGCSVGDQSAALAARGARVIGVDRNEDLLREARARNLDNADFLLHELGALPDLGVVADGIWCSFTAAYFPDLAAALASWARHLRPGGWIALTEIDDLFGHEPLGADIKALFERFTGEALAAKRYDFHMGRKLRHHLERAGFTVSRILTLADRELSFTGPALPEVIEAWSDRFDRLKLLQRACGGEFARVRREFLDCLARADHVSTAKVYCCIATR